MHHFKLAAILALTVLLPPAALAETRTIIPDVYYDTFSFAHEPVGRIKPGDTVNTTMLDSRGHDKTGKLVIYADNVLTGPFYIEGAEPGDTLVVHFDKVRLNRDWGWNGVRVGLSALSPGYVRNVYDNNYLEEWLQPGAAQRAEVAHRPRKEGHLSDAAAGRQGEDGVPGGSGCRVRGDKPPQAEVLLVALAGGARPPASVAAAGGGRAAAGSGADPSRAMVHVAHGVAAQGAVERRSEALRVGGAIGSCGVWVKPPGPTAGYGKPYVRWGGRVPGRNPRHPTRSSRCRSEYGPYAGARHIFDGPVERRRPAGQAPAR